MFPTPNSSINIDELSAIHDHPNSHCVMKILKGNMIEKRFSHPQTQGPETSPALSAVSINSISDTNMKQISCRTLPTNSVSYMHDEFGVHQMCNESTERAVSIHIYSPPIPACKIFDADSGSFKQVDSSRIDSRNRTPVVCIEPKSGKS